MKEKACTRCAGAKPLSEFNRRRASPDGRASMCRSCSAKGRADSVAPRWKSKIAGSGAPFGDSNRWLSKPI